MAVDLVGPNASTVLAAAATAHSTTLPAIAADASALPIRSTSADLMVACMSLLDIDDLDALSTNGFVVEQIREPRLPERLVEQDTSRERWRWMPNALHVRALRSSDPAP